MAVLMLALLFGAVGGSWSSVDLMVTFEGTSERVFVTLDTRDVSRERIRAALEADPRLLMHGPQVMESNVDVLMAVGEAVTRQASRDAAPLVAAELLTPELAAPLPWLPRCPLQGDPAQVVEHVRTAVSLARRGLSKLSRTELRGALTAEGMSDAHVRHLLNNINAAPGARYLEIGSYKGSTLVAALAGNEGANNRAVAIDGWFPPGATHLYNDGDAVKRAFHAHVDAHLDPVFTRDAARFKILRRDAFQIADVNGELQLGPFDVYFYDGGHDREEQARAFTHYDQALAQTFVAIVDDFNFPSVRQGTADAFRALNYTVLYGEYLGGGFANAHYRGAWHNGIYVAVVQKQEGDPAAKRREARL